MAGKQPAKNILDANYRYRTQDTRVAELNKQLGMLGVDDMIAIQADGTMNIKSSNDADGVDYSGGANTAEAYVPTVRKPGNPTEGMPGA